MTDEDRIDMIQTIKPFNVIDRSELPEVKVDWVPFIGSPLEIDSKKYITCEINNQPEYGWLRVGVIPLVYKNDNETFNTENYQESLYSALRKIQDLRIIQVSQN